MPRDVAWIHRGRVIVHHEVKPSQPAREEARSCKEIHPDRIWRDARRYAKFVSWAEEADAKLSRVRSLRFARTRMQRTTHKPSERMIIGCLEEALCISGMNCDSIK